MNLETRHVTIRLDADMTSGDAVHGGQALEESWVEPGKQLQILGMILSDPKLARDELAVFPACLSMARRKAHAGGFGKGGLFCALDPESHPCNPDAPPEIPLDLRPSFDLASLVIDYYRACLDFKFFLSGGADLIVETARLWSEVTASGQVIALEEQNHLLELVRLNLRWIGELWTKLEIAGKQQDVAARLNLSDNEVQTLVRLVDQLPSADPNPLSETEFENLNHLIRHIQHLPPGSLQNGHEAGFLAMVATQVGGLSIEDSELSFAPTLPTGWQGYDLLLTYRGSKLKVQIDGKDGRMTLTEGSAIPILVNGLEYMLEDEFAFDLA